MIPRRYQDAYSAPIPERMTDLQVDKWWLMVNPDSDLQRSHPCCVCSDVLGMTKDHFLSTIKKDKIFVPGGKALGPVKLAATSMFKSEDSNGRNMETKRKLVWIAWGSPPSWSPMDQINGLCKLPHKVFCAAQRYAAHMRRERLSFGTAASANDADDANDAVEVDDADDAKPNSVEELVKKCELCLWIAKS